MEAAYQGRMRALLGLYPLPCEQGLQVLRDVLNQDGGQYVIVYGEASRHAPVLATHIEQKSSMNLSSSTSAERELYNRIRHELKMMVSKLLKLPLERLETNEYLMSYGFDSICSRALPLN